MAFASLTIDLNARLAKFDEDMSKAGRSMDGLNRRAAALSTGLKAAFGAASIAGVAAFAKSGIDAADALNDMSQRLGVSVKDLASFRLAAEQYGTSLEGIGTGMAKLTNSIGEAERGNKQIAAALRDLGISARDPKEAFFQLADAVQRIEDPSKRAALLSQVLGKSYGELVPLLAQGSAALRESARQSETFADAMARLAPEADKFNDHLAELKSNAAGAAANGLVPLVKSFNEMIAAFRQTKSEAALTSDLFDRSIVTVFQAVAVTGANVAFVFQGIGREIGGMAAQLSALARLDFKAFNFIGSALKEDSAAARKELDALEKRLMSIGQTAVAATNKQKSTLGSSDFAKALSKAGGSSAKFDPTKLPQIDPWLKERTAAMKAAAFEVAETERLIAEHLQSTNDALYDQAQAWTEAGRALEDEMRTPLERANIEFARLDDMLERGSITWETYSRAVMKVSEGLDEVPEKLKEMDNFAKTAAENIQNSFADFLFDPFQNGLDGMLQGFGQMVQKMIAEAVAADLAKRLFGSLSGGTGSGLAGGLLTGLGSLFGFASGGVMSGSGSMPLQRYASGGIATMPQLALFGEGAMNEAFVPLPDGRSIPVKMKGTGGGGGPTINVYVQGSNNVPDLRRAVGQGAREGLAAIKGAQRYV